MILGPFQSDSAFIWAIDLGGEDRLAALDEDGQLLQWDARTGEGSEPIKVFDATGTVIRIGDGGTLMAAARDGRIASDPAGFPAACRDRPPESA